MSMDPRVGRYPTSFNGLSLDNNQSLSWFPDPSLVPGTRFETNGFRGGVQFVPPEATHINVSPSATNSCVTQEDDSVEDCDFSDEVLRYIREMLMEEDMEDKSCMLQESLDLQAAEKSLYEAIGKKYPPSPEPIPNCTDLSGPDDNFSADGHNCLTDNAFLLNSHENTILSQEQSFSFYGASQSSYSSTNSIVSGVNGLVDSPGSIAQVPGLDSENQSIWQFKKGVEEANKFLPSGSEFFDSVELKGSLAEPIVRPSEVEIKLERKEESLYSPNSSRGRKNPHRGSADLEEERSSKQAAVFPESPLRSEMFDIVLLCTPGSQSHITVLQETLQDGTTASMLRNGQNKGSIGRRGRGKKQNGKKEVVDLRTLLINCAQAVASGDRLTSTEILKQIRQHASPFGDGNQRLAHCLADGLEARQAGTGSQIYKGLISKRASAADMLKAYHLYLAACPFRKLSNFISSKTIMNVASESMRIHIIDFGILYGFQWPTLIQLLAMRAGGPPKIRITGIDFPQPGFRPAERVEETGRRLAAYAESFNVPFEYNAIAKKWETIKVEELKIDEDELLVVNCMYRSKNLLDESVAAESPRTLVTRLVRKINPDIFIHGIVNGSYNAPFFVTRFREALFHFSALFDMLETLVTRENRARMLIEKEIFGREALNVVACEGWERVERPETYKQWQVRNIRAGFMQLSFDREIVKRATDKVRSSYHKDFMIDEDSHWVLQGWKGRIIYALSLWRRVQ